MRGARPLALALWLLGMGAAGAIIARAHLSADLSAFLPRSPSATERLLVDQLQNGLAAHLILIGIEGGDAAERAAAARGLCARLREAAAFLSVNDGEEAISAADRDCLFRHRYQLSATVTPQRFEAAGLRSAIESTLELIASPAGLGAQELLRTDPTGETLQLIDQLGAGAGAAPHREQGVWSSPDGRRALLIAETRAGGGDIDGQAGALASIRAAFAAAAPASQGLRLLLSGPGVFALQARDTIRREALRLSLLSGALISGLLLAVYRSGRTLLLALLPVLSGALAGIAAVALGDGVVHGVTLGFGVTLIGESVDYSIYFLIQSHRGSAPGAPLEVPAHLWPTIGLGVLTSVCGFASLLPSGFPGLSQLGLFSIAGLLAAAAVTRGVLPQLLPMHLRVRDISALGAAAARLLARSRGLRTLVLVAGALAGAVLYAHRSALWNRDLTALSPVAAEAQRLDGGLRSDLGAPDIGHLVVVSGPDQESALEVAERIAPRLEALATAGIIAGYDSPAHYLPSERTQEARRASLPDASELRRRLAAATADLPLRTAALEPFIAAVATARTAPLLTRAALAPTSLGLALDGRLWSHAGRWYGLLPLRAPQAPGGAGEIDMSRVRAALSGEPAGSALALNMKREVDALYDRYQREAIRLSLGGLAAIVLLLAVALRDPVRLLRVLAPLLLAVLVVAAGLIASGVTLTILHLIGLRLIVAVGSNYALFFDRPAGAAAASALPRTLASLLIANLCTVIGFGVLALAQVPVLRALGCTVAPGALLALWFAALLAPRALMQRTAAQLR